MKKQNLAQNLYVERPRKDKEGQRTYMFEEISFVCPKKLVH